MPLQEEQEDAMENKSFQQFLEMLGVAPPANEQVSHMLCSDVANTQKLK